MVLENKLNITGFAFKEGVTQEQKDEAFGNVINSFVSESLTDILNSLKNKSYSFSLVDINKLELVVNPGLGERYFIWLLIACTKPQAERRALEAMMGYREVEDVRIVRSENGCIVKGIFDIQY